MTTFMNGKEQGEIAYLLLFSLPLSLSLSRIRNI